MLDCAAIIPKQTHFQLLRNSLVIIRQMISKKKKLAERKLLIHKHYSADYFCRNDIRTDDSVQKKHFWVQTKRLYSMGRGMSINNIKKHLRTPMPRNCSIENRTWKLPRLELRTSIQVE